MLRSKRFQGREDHVTPLGISHIPGEIDRGLSISVACGLQSVASTSSNIADDSTKPMSPRGGRPRRVGRHDEVAWDETVTVFLSIDLERWEDALAPREFATEFLDRSG
jgi:hypothetical protein